MRKLTRSNGAEGEAKGHPRDGTPLDSPMSKQRVDDVVHDGDHDDDADRVHVVEQIVGQAVRSHTGRQGVGGSSETTVVDVEDGYEEEDAAGLEGTTAILDELVVVRVRLCAPRRRTNTGLALLPEARTADPLEAAVRDAVAHDPEDVAQVGSSGRLLDQAWVEIPQKGREQEVEDGWDQIGGPVADDPGQIGGGDAEAGADVDEEVEPQHDAVDGLFRVDDDFFTVHLDDVLDLVRALVHDGRRDVGLELSRTDGQCVERESKGADGVARLEDRRQSRDDHDDVGHTADGHTLADHPEPTILGVGEPAEEDGKGIGHELEGLGHGRGYDRAPAQSTGGVGGMQRSGGTGAGTVGRERSADEVLVHLEATVVTGSLGKLDGAQVVARRRHLACHPLQRSLVLLGR